MEFCFSDKCSHLEMLRSALLIGGSITCAPDKEDYAWH